MSLKRIAVVGLGLIGGSLAARSRKAFPRVRIVGVSRNRGALARAKRKKWIHEGTDHLEQGIQSADLIVLCTPVDTLKSLLKRIDRAARSPVVVTDAGSVKGFLVRWADRQKWRHLRFVGAHPMAGSHQRGIEAAQPNLFDHALTFVTPGNKTPDTAFRQVKKFWAKVSQKVAVISPETHDRLTAEVSHLPHLVASLLVAGTDPQSLRFAASGFLDTTRVAKSDPGLWAPIFTENRKELLRALDRFGSQIRRAKRMLQKGNPQTLRKILREVQKRRAALE